MSTVMKRLEAGRLRRKRIGELLRTVTGTISLKDQTPVTLTRVQANMLAPGFYLLINDRTAPKQEGNQEAIAFFRLEHPEGFPVERYRAIMDAFNAYYLGEKANVAEVTYVDQSVLILKNPFTGNATPLNLTVTPGAVFGGKLNVQ